jgi:hypothetical protein
MILELRNKSIRHRQDNVDKAMLIHAELGKWWNELQDAIDIYPGEEYQEEEEEEDERSTKMQEVHRLLLQVSMQESIISLNRPLLVSDKTRSAYSAALHDCIGASQKVISILRRSLHSSIKPSSDHDKSPILLVWPSLTWAIWMSCFILIYATNEGHYPVRSALR